MNETLASGTTQNVVDKAASSATKTVEATKTAAASALDGLSDKVESVRSTLSPVLDSASAPFDAVLKYTRENPVNALLAAALGGAVVFAIVRPRRRARIR